MIYVLLAYAAVTSFWIGAHVFSTWFRSAVEEQFAAQGRVLIPSRRFIYVIVASMAWPLSLAALMGQTILALLMSPFLAPIVCESCGARGEDS